MPRELAGNALGRPTARQERAKRGAQQNLNLYPKVDDGGSMLHLSADDLSSALADVQPLDVLAPGTAGPPRPAAGRGGGGGDGRGGSLCGAGTTGAPPAFPGGGGGGGAAPR